MNKRNRSILSRSQDQNLLCIVLGISAKVLRTLLFVAFSGSKFAKQILARLAGFGPATPWFVARYSIQLSYRRKNSASMVFLSLRYHAKANFSRILKGYSRGLLRMMRGFKAFSSVRHFSRKLYTCFLGHADFFLFRAL